MNPYQSTILKLMSLQIHENEYTDIPCYRGGRLKLRSLLLMKWIGSRTPGCLCSVLNSSIPDPWWFLVGRSLDGSSNLQPYKTILYHSKHRRGRSCEQCFTVSIKFRSNSIFTNATNLIIFMKCVVLNSFYWEIQQVC